MTEAAQTIGLPVGKAGNVQGSKMKMTENNILK
jgi:hypothetical protein